MCAIYGFLQYKGNITKKRINILVKVLAVEGQVRGRDATGVAYLLHGYTSSFDVPEGAYFVMGDNRAASIDSRFWERTYVWEDEITAKQGIHFWFM